MEAGTDGDGRMECRRWGKPTAGLLAAVLCLLLLVKRQGTSVAVAEGAVGGAGGVLAKGTVGGAGGLVADGALGDARGVVAKDAMGGAGGVAERAVGGAGGAAKGAVGDARGGVAEGAVGGARGVVAEGAAGDVVAGDPPLPLSVADAAPNALVDPGPHGWKLFTELTEGQSSSVAPLARRRLCEFK